MAMVGGQWQEEDASVERRVAGMVQSGSPLMKVAQTGAAKEANRRGLGNSSIAVGKGAEAVIKTATPIASQDAGQIHERNLSGQNFVQTRTITGDQIAGQKEITGMQIGSQERISSADRTSRENLNAADNAGAMARTQLTETGATARNTADNAGALTRTQLTESGAMDRTRLTESGATARTNLDIAGARDRTVLTEAGATARNTADNTGAMARTQVSETGATGRNNAQIAAQGSANAITALKGANDTYTAGYNAIMNNPDIPADVRSQHLIHLGVTRDNTIRLIETTFNISLPWARTPGSGDSTPTGQTPQPVLPSVPTPAAPTMPSGWDPDTGRWVGE